MCDCLCDGSPVEDKRGLYKYNARQWETSMLHAGCNQPLGCLAAMCFPCCCAMYLRYKALNEDMSKYSCCQGFICPSITKCFPGQDDCPWCCLCLEVTLCESCAISATRIYVQVERQIITDPCDNRIIRFNNFMQILSCVCNILAIFIDGLDALAALIDLIADIVYCLTQACMQAQTFHELKLHPTATDYDGVSGGAITQQPKMQQQHPAQHHHQPGNFNAIQQPYPPQQQQQQQQYYPPMAYPPQQQHQQQQAYPPQGYPPQYTPSAAPYPPQQHYPPRQ
ncbi:hypothetical protein PTSG_06545 [Salpingoeca rosetta]|uniref:Uncharacterized protein n=1 Tax=Salpingoeca rosetta (strain ATCC 50818 / BSB-021) TaxID=946362 RepID=F2UG43_SALR5|nr:uncharacterized protein PTSG_06545 [Salpingoeca rosetta]EGD75471.1 hypothetical protein PTSG_06545 [Salpingoeca rosetta]|eukprot:XP_004991928.1 hypothetical protein PTSG_06545 [Salpingoeca rosetta]